MRDLEKLGDPLSAVLPNGSTLDGRWPQLFETQQHGEHPFELAVEMNLVTGDFSQRLPYATLKSLPRMSSTNFNWLPDTSTGSIFFDMFVS